LEKRELINRLTASGLLLIIFFIARYKGMIYGSELLSFIILTSAVIIILYERMVYSGLLLIAFFIPLCEAMIYVGMLLVFIGWIYKLARKKSKGVLRTPLDLPIIIFVIIGFISIFNSSFLKQSLTVTPGFIAGILFGYYLVFSNITDKKFLKKFVLVMVLGGTTTACIGIFQYLIWGTERTSATLANPNVLASYLAMMIPIVFSLLLYESKKSKKKLLLTFSLITMVICLILTRSRAGWLALVGAMSFLLLIEKKKRLAVGLTLIIIVVASILIPSVNARLRTIFDLIVNKERIYGAKSALQMIKDYPLTGIGVNTFYHVYPQYQLPEAKEHLVHAHNIFLQIGAEIGLFGVVTLLWLLIRVFKIGWEILRKAKDDYLRALAIGLLASLIAFLIDQEFDSTWWLERLFIFFWVLLAVLLAARNITLENRNV